MDIRYKSIKIVVNHAMRGQKFAILSGDKLMVCPFLYESIEDEETFQTVMQTIKVIKLDPIDFDCRNIDLQVDFSDRLLNKLPGLDRFL